MPGKNRDRIGLIPSLRSALTGVARLAELLVFPSLCRRCGDLLDRPGERVLCGRCLAALVVCEAPFCPECGRFFAGAGGPHACGHCLPSKPSFSTHRSAARYEGVLKDALLLFKYRGYRPLGRPLARFAYSAFKGNASLWSGADILVPVPLHKKRRRKRGFNQAEVLARELSRWTGIPVEAGSLRRIVSVMPQTTLRREARRANVRDAFEIRRPSRIEGKVVVLVDDVFTTGSTIGECSRMLKKAGAAEVRAVTIAQA